MASIKARWKRAPRDHRRVAPERTAPKARFTRNRRSLSLPRLGGSAGGGRTPPLLIFAGALALLAVLSVTAVIAVGTFLHAQQQYDDLQWRAGYYGRPTLPFSTLAPQQQVAAVSTTVPLLTTPLPLSQEAGLTVADSGAALTEPDGDSSGGTTISSFCADFGVPVAINIFDWDDWSSVNLTNPLVAQLPMAWDVSTDIWQGYQSAQPFNQPDDARDRWKLQLFTADGTERWIYIAQSPSTPDTLYVYAFQRIDPYTDRHGNHFGYHPCRAFSLPFNQINILLSSARAYQSSGSRFPAFVAGDDPRWTHGNVTPVSGSFDLRSIPTLLNNDPLNTVSQAASGYFITDPDWGVWAQVKLGNVTAWVDTTTVTLESAS